MNQEAVGSIPTVRPKLLMGSGAIGGALGFDPNGCRFDPYLPSQQFLKGAAMILKTRATRMTSRKLSNLEEELKPLLARAMAGAASSQESERIQMIFSLCRQANKLEQYRVWHSQVKAGSAHPGSAGGSPAHGQR